MIIIVNKEREQEVASERTAARNFERTIVSTARSQQFSRNC